MVAIMHGKFEVRNYEKLYQSFATMVTLGPGNSFSQQSPSRCPALQEQISEPAIQHVMTVQLDQQDLSQGQDSSLVSALPIT